MSVMHEAEQNELRERIVREVLARLQPNIVAAGNGASHENQEQPTTSDRLEIAERVVTVSTLVGRVAGKRTIIVLPHAVVTPAARDFLRELGLTIERQSQRVQQAQLGLRRVVGVAETSYEPAAMLAGLRGQEFEQVARVGLVGVVDEIVDRVARGGAVGLIFTDQADAVLCLANRSAGVRAVLARSAAAVRQARGTIAANLLVVEPKSKSVFELRQIVTASATASGHTLGEVSRKRLA